MLANIIQRAGPGENQYFSSCGREITSSAPKKKNRNSSALVTCLPHCFARRRLLIYNNMVYRWLRSIGSDTYPVLNRVKSPYDLLKSSKYYYDLSQMDRLYSKIIDTPRVRADMWYILFSLFARLEVGILYAILILRTRQFRRPPSPPIPERAKSYIQKGRNGVPCAMYIRCV